MSEYGYFKNIGYRLSCAQGFSNKTPKSYNSPRNSKSLEKSYKNIFFYKKQSKW